MEDIAWLRGDTKSILKVVVVGLRGGGIGSKSRCKENRKVFLQFTEHKIYILRNTKKKDIFHSNLYLENQWEHCFGRHRSHFSPFYFKSSKRKIALHRRLMQQNRTNYLSRLSIVYYVITRVQNNRKRNQNKSSRWINFLTKHYL